MPGTESGRDMLITRAIIKSIPIAAYLRDAELNYLGFSPAFAEMAGICDSKKNHEISGLSVLDEYDRSSIAENRDIKAGSTSPFGPGGMLFSRYVLRNENGIPIGVMGIAEHEPDQISLGRLYLDAALSSNNLSFLEYDFSTGCLTKAGGGLSPSGEYQIGPLPDSLIEGGCVHPDSVPEFIRATELMISGADEYDGVLLIRMPGDDNYRYKHIHCTVSRRQSGEPRKIVCLAEDVTELQRAIISYKRELELRTSRGDPKVFASVIFDLTSDSVELKKWEYTEGASALSACEFIRQASAIVSEESARQHILKYNVHKLRDAFRSSRRDLIYEFLCRLPNGKSGWARCICSFLIDPENGHLMMPGVLKDIESDTLSARKLRMAAEQDPLTGLFNHGATLRRIESWLNENTEGIHALFMIDLDDFKRVNDTFGHICGDNVIKDMSAAIKRTFRSSDIVGRVGGDEFMALMKNIPGEEQARKKASDLVRAMEYICISNGRSMQLSASVGVAICRGGEDFASLRAGADNALYAAKKAGKNRFSVTGAQLENPISENRQYDYNMIDLGSMLKSCGCGLMSVAEEDGTAIIEYTGSSFFSLIFPDAYSGFDFFDHVSPSCLDDVRQVMLSACSGQISSCRFNLMAPDGAELPCTLTASPVLTGGKSRAICTVNGLFPPFFPNSVQTI